MDKRGSVHTHGLPLRPERTKTIRSDMAQREMSDREKKEDRPTAGTTNTHQRICSLVSHVRLFRATTTGVYTGSLSMQILQASTLQVAVLLLQGNLPTHDQPCIPVVLHHRLIPYSKPRLSLGKYIQGNFNKNNKQMYVFQKSHHTYSISQHISYNYI